MLPNGSIANLSNIKNILRKEKEKVTIWLMNHEKVNIMKSFNEMKMLRNRICYVA